MHGTHRGFKGKIAISVEPDALAESLGAFSRRFGVEPMPVGQRPVFLLSAGWRSGSTLVQRLLMSDPNIFMWGEPYSHSALIRRLSESLAPFGDGWPSESYIATRARTLPSSDDWIANLYPHPRHLIAAHRALFDALFDASARHLGKERWGLKAVRLHGADVAYLRLLYPDAAVVLLHRNPYDAFLSYRLLLEVRAHSSWWFHLWPDDQVSDAVRFGEIWARLVVSFLKWAPQLDGVVLAYEDLLRGRGLDELADRTELSLDRSVLDRRIGGTRDQRGDWDGARLALSEEEESAIRRATGSVARSLGYLGPS